MNEELCPIGLPPSRKLTEANIYKLPWIELIQWQSPSLPLQSSFIRSLPKLTRKPLIKVIPYANGKGTLYLCRTLCALITDVRQAILLLDEILQIDPERRCSAEEALEEQYLAPYHDPWDEPVAKEKSDWGLLDADLPADVWKTVMYRHGDRKTKINPLMEHSVADRE